MISTYKSEIEPTAVKAAAGFHTESQGESESNADFEFLFTRAIEFRQETIYFLIVDRFNDGDPNNNPGSNPQLFIGISFILVNIWINLLWRKISQPRRGGRLIYHSLFTFKQMLCLLKHCIDRIYQIVDGIYLPSG